MASKSNAVGNGPSAGPLHGFHLLVEPDPWLRVFLRNLGDLFRREAPPAYTTSSAGEYWSDALVHRPVAWTQMAQSVICHIVMIATVLSVDWLWRTQPRVIVEDPRQTSVLQYQVSEYLPEIRSNESEDKPPIREKAQKADPEYAPQKIVSLNAEHNSLRQTIVQPEPVMLQQDVPLPNIVAITAVPGAPVASRHQLAELPTGTPQVVPPTEAAVAHSKLVFPVTSPPQVVAPASAAANYQISQQLLAMNGPVVIAPSSQPTASDALRLQLPAQAPQAVAAPPSEIASGHALTQALGGGKPEVVPPSQETAGRRNLVAMGLPGESHDVVPPAQPITSGPGAQSREIGQLLALNARPIQPSGPVTVPAGNRRGEFTAGPEGRVGASGAPETRAGDPLLDRPGGAGSSAGSGSIFVSPPPGRIASGPVMSSGVPLAPEPPRVPVARPDIPSERVENEVFAGRRQHAMRLNMPNVNSGMGSWTVHFAEMHTEDETTAAISAPEAVHKVDPAYPPSLLRDRVEGVVILHAIIRADGTVDGVSVLEGFNEMLDANARSALQQWRFRPGLKNGIPIDVEAVIRVPFRVPRIGF